MTNDETSNDETATNNPQPAGSPLVSSRTRRPVHFRVPTDMVVYAAFLGKAPSIDPKLADPIVAANHARRENPWSPAVLSIYLREVCRGKSAEDEQTRTQRLDPPAGGDRPQAICRIADPRDRRPARPGGVMMNDE